MAKNEKASRGGWEEQFLMAVREVERSREVLMAYRTLLRVVMTYDNVDVDSMLDADASSENASLDEAVHDWARGLPKSATEDIADDALEIHKNWGGEADG